MLVLTHNDCILHQPPKDHPESPERLRAVMSVLGAIDGLQLVEAPLATRLQLELAHPVEYLDHLEQQLKQVAITNGVLAVDPDTWLSTYSLAAAQRAVGAACTAVDRVMQSANKRIFCAVRPPGHHAECSTAMGFVFIRQWRSPLYTQ